MERALQLYEALQGCFRAGHDLYSGHYPPGRRPRFAYVWPHSQVVAAMVAMVRAAGTGRRYREAASSAVRGLDLYRDVRAEPASYASSPRPPLGPGGEKYFDDNEWIGLVLIDWAEITGDSWPLQLSQHVFDFVTTGWDLDPSHPLPGGVYWCESPSRRARNTVSTAGGAQLGLRLYALTGRRSSLEWSMRMLDWVRSSMRAPDGLYWDHVEPSGRIDEAKWSYNQGLMVGASCLAYLATGEQSHLEHAREVADLALTHFGDVGWLGQPPEFNAIFLDNLVLLDSVDAEAARAVSMQGYAEAVWDQLVDRPTGLLLPGDDGRVELLQQAGALRLMALLSRVGPS